MYNLVVHEARTQCVDHAWILASRKLAALIFVYSYFEKGCHQKCAPDNPERSLESLFPDTLSNLLLLLIGEVLFTFSASLTYAHHYLM